MACWFSRHSSCSLHHDGTGASGHLILSPAGAVEMRWRARVELDAKMVECHRGARAAITREDASKKQGAETAMSRIMDHVTLQNGRWLSVSSVRRSSGCQSLQPNPSARQRYFQNMRPVPTAVPPLLEFAPQSNSGAPHLSPLYPDDMWLTNKVAGVSILSGTFHSPPSATSVRLLFQDHMDCVLRHSKMAISAKCRKCRLSDSRKARGRLSLTATWSLGRSGPLPRPMTFLSWGKKRITRPL